MDKEGWQMILAIVGSRDFEDYDYMCQVLNEWVALHGRPHHVVSGGAVGADTLGKKWAESKGIEVIEHEPKYYHHGPVAPFKRNTKIAKECDFMVAFPLETGGTWHAIQEAKKLDKPVWIRVDGMEIKNG